MVEQYAAGIIIALSLALFASAVSLCMVIQHYQGVVKDIMDRLMARDWPEYQAGVAVAKRAPLKRWAVDDERAAQLEAERSASRKVEASV